MRRIILDADAFSVLAERRPGAEKLAAVDLTLPGGAGFTVSGNVSSGAIVLNGAALPSPWDQLNVP